MMSETIRIEEGSEASSSVPSKGTLRGSGYPRSTIFLEIVFVPVDKRQK
jgi:hypothetical protein